MDGRLRATIPGTAQVVGEDLAKHQAVRKGKAVATDPSPQKDHASIMVIEEDLAAMAPARPDELITL